MVAASSADSGTISSVLLADVLSNVVVVTSILIAASIPFFIGFERVFRTKIEWRSRIQTAAPVIAVLAAVLLFNRFARRHLESLSWEHGFVMTPTFYDVEGEFIVWFQSYPYEWLVQYFSFIYVYGYVFLLVFPVIAYFALSDSRPFRQLLTAYTLNYAFGLVLYFLVIAYGPRNIMPEVFEITLYDFEPRYQTLTREVNTYTNVFPSLHTSLAVTVGMFAVLTREEYPKWTPVAVVLAVSVAISTMYLGIHWAIDVVAGTVFALLCVWVSILAVDRWQLWKRVSDRLSEFVSDRWG